MAVSKAQRRGYMRYVKGIGELHVELCKCFNFMDLLSFKYNNIIEVSIRYLMPELTFAMLQ
jgi:hypothetical protein